MKERPILFSGAMVRALLAGTKTQTRRVAKTDITIGRDSILAPNRGQKHAPVFLLPEHAADAVAYCPYGQPGDRLWVREAFGHFERNDNFTPGCEVFYRADGESLAVEPWRPSIHMPRWASRITLEVTGVRVERLQDISEADALAEGIVRLRDDGFGLADTAHYHYTDPRESYFSLWETINGEGSVEANPWVWAVDFKRLEAAT